MTKKNFLFISLLFFLIVFSRFIFLDLRPLHHDEGVNYFFADNIAEGRGWRYDPTNYHGPLFFFVLALSFLFLGVSEFSLRFPAALFGIAMAVLPLFLRFKDEKFERYGKYLASVFLLLSPSLLYYSRYSIHEVSFVLFSFIGVYLLSLILEKRDMSYLPYLALCLALLFTIKETVIIFFLVLFMMILANFKKVKEVEFKEHYRIVWFSVFLFLFVYSLLFTNFFSYGQGFLDSFGAFMPWIERGMGEIGHDKPFYYYFFLILRYELPLLLLGLIGLASAWKKDIFSRGVVIWFLLTFLVYSFISYKTPWLIINMTVPLGFLAVFGTAWLFEKRGKAFGGVVLALSILYLMYFSWMVNFAQPWQSSNSFAYVHTSGEALKLVGAVEEIDGKILIVFNESDYWPLPFYFDQREVGYLSDLSDLAPEDYRKAFQDHKILIVQDRLFSPGDVPEGYSYEKHRLRDGVEMWVVYQKV